MLTSEPIFTVKADLSRTETFGITPYGERRVVHILGGSVTGPLLSGRILPGGADWQVVRSDGVTDISARYVIETETGARVVVNSEGLRHGPPEVIERLARGDAVDPSLYYFRTIMRFETADAGLARFNRILAVARGRREARAVHLDVFEIL